MEIEHFDMSKGRWVPVPISQLFDNRLSISGRGAVISITAKFKNEKPSVDQVREFLGVGDSKWRGLSTELKLNGYLEYSKTRDSKGKFKTNVVFNPTPKSAIEWVNSQKNVGFNVAEKNKGSDSALNRPGVGSPPVAKPHITPIDLGILKKTPPTDPKRSCGSQRLDIPELWHKAADFEMALYSKKTQIENVGGFRAAIFSRYTLNNGPDPMIVGAMKKHDLMQEKLLTDELLRRKEEEKKVDQAKEEKLQLDTAASICGAISAKARQAVADICKCKRYGSVTGHKLPDFMLNNFLEFGIIPTGMFRAIFVSELLKHGK